MNGRETAIRAEEDPLAREALCVAALAVPGFEPRCCELLKRGKSAVFAVHPHGGQTSLVVKLADAGTIGVERTILSWLEDSPIPSVRVHAVVPSAPGRAWLVSELVCGVPYESRSARDRDLVAMWLGDLHVWSRSVTPPCLPIRDLNFYRGVVHEASATLRDAGRFGAALESGDREVVRSLLGATERLLSHWERVSELLAALPETLVHSGIAGKNVYIVESESRPTVMAFDWEQGGWGCPAADVSMANLNTYAARLAQHGLIVRASDSLFWVGQALWCLAGVPGERGNLMGAWPQRAARKLGYYLARVNSALKYLGKSGLP